MGSGYPWAPGRWRARTQGYRLALYAQPCPLRRRPLLGIHWGARRRWKHCERSFQARASFHSAGPSGFWCPLFFVFFWFAIFLTFSTAIYITRTRGHFGHEAPNGHISEAIQFPLKRAPSNWKPLCWSGAGRWCPVNGPRWCPVGVPPNFRSRKHL